MHQLAVMPHTEMIINFASAGSAACFADMITFPLDTAKVRLQVQSSGTAKIYKGMVGTLVTISRQEGFKALYNGLVAGLQRQLCFASIRIGFYDSAKTFYGGMINGKPSATQTFMIRICAGLTTGGAAVLFAQPTDVVKVRMQAQKPTSAIRYTSCLNAYHTIATSEGVRGLWKGTMPNVARNAIVNVSEIVCYDIIKTNILHHKLMRDSIPCHFVSAICAGFCTTVVASPVDVVKTRVMNGAPGQYRGVVDCAMRMYREGGAATFYKGFMPSFYRMVSWNIVMWISYEQIKIAMTNAATGKPALAV